MKRVHFAWFVCLGGALVAFTTMGLGINVFSIYQPEIIRLNGFTNAQGSWITTTRSLFILFALLTVNWMCARLGERVVMTLGIALSVLSCVCFGLARSFPMYCAAAALAGLAYCYGGTIPMSLVIGRWFQDRQRMALGTASAGSGVSTVLAPIVITQIISSQGIRTAFLCESLVMAGAGVLVWLCIRNDPAGMGMEPYRRERRAAPEQAAPPARPAHGGMSRRQRLLLLLAALFVGATGGPGFSHLGVLYTREGYSSMLVAALITYSGAAISVGKITLGQVFDWLGGYRGNYYIFGVMLAGLGLCTMTPLGGSVLPFLSITAYSMGVCISVVAPTQWAADLSGGTDYQRELRSISLAYTAGMLLFGPVPGAIADRCSSYAPAYGLFGLLLLASMAIIQGIYRSLLRPSPAKSRTPR